MREMKKAVILTLVMSMFLLLTGCSVLSEERVKLNDLGFTVVSDEKVPAELKTIIDEKKETPFKITYSADGFLYIVIGYGQQPSGGYSIAVNELYLTNEAIYVSTTLLGPEDIDINHRVPSCPYIVLKLDYLDKPVIFE